MMYRSLGDAPSFSSNKCASRSTVRVAALFPSTRTVTISMKMQIPFLLLVTGVMVRSVVCFVDIWVMSRLRSLVISLLGYQSKHIRSDILFQYTDWHEINEDSVTISISGGWLGLDSRCGLFFRNLADTPSNANDGFASRLTLRVSTLHGLARYH